MNTIIDFSFFNISIKGKHDKNSVTILNKYRKKIVYKLVLNIFINLLIFCRKSYFNFRNFLAIIEKGKEDWDSCLPSPSVLFQQEESHIYFLGIV